MCVSQPKRDGGAPASAPFRIRAGLIPALMGRLSAWAGRHSHSLAAFFCAVILMQIAYAVMGAYPFGGKTLLTTDLYHQYAPFLAELRNKLLHGESLFYSWNGGLGSNFYATLSYYLASPLNLLLLVFPAGWLTEAILTITLVKIGLAAAFFAAWSRDEFGQDRIAAVAFSLMYALSGYVLAYAWNLMWLDAIYLLPVVVMGLSRLIRGGRATLYVFSLALMLVSNVYIGSFSCLFLVLYLPLLILKHGAGQAPGVVFRKILAFAGASLLAAGMAAFMILPMLEAIQHTSAAHDAFPKTLDPYADLFLYGARHFVAAAPNNKDGLPNLYAGIAVLFLFPLYLLDSGVPRRERAGHLLLLAFLLLGFNLNVLNFIWHGFHFPNMLPYRNAYLYIFLLVTACMPALTRLRHWPARRTALCFAGAGLLVILSQRINDPKPGFHDVYLSLLFLFLYFPVMTGGCLDTMKPVTRSALFALVVILEIGTNAVLVVGQFDTDMAYAKRDGYVTGGDTGPIRDALANLRAADSSFWRAELVSGTTVNDPHLYQYRGLSLFSSMNSQAMTTMAIRYGYQGNGFNNYAYVGQTPFMDALLGVTYLLRRSGDVDDPIRERIQKQGAVSVYRHPDALPLGFMAPAAAKTWKSAERTPIENQNRLADLLTGQKALFVPLALAPAADAIESTLTTNGNNGYALKWPDRSRQAIAQVHYDIKEEQSLYLDLRPSPLRFYGGNLIVGDVRRSFSATYDTVLDVGRVQPGTRVTVELWGAPTHGDPYAFTLIPYGLKADRYHAAMTELSARSFQVTRQRDSSVSGTIQAGQGGVLVMTIPFNTGWTVRLDGVTVNAFAFDGGLLALDVPAGTHQVSLSFTPRFFWLGLGISVCCLLMAGRGACRRQGTPGPG